MIIVQFFNIPPTRPSWTSRFRPVALLFLLFWMPAAAAADCPATQSEAARRLVPNTPIEREIKGGETQAYRLALETGQFTLLVVKPDNRDIVVAITGPDGRKFIDMSLKEVGIVAEAPGEYLIQAHTRYRTAPAGRYEISITPPRPATPQDKTRALAERSLNEAEFLYGQTKPASTREAIEKLQTAASLFHEAQQPSLEALALLRIGEGYLSLYEKVPTAREHFNQALALARGQGDRWREAQALEDIGRSYFAIEGAQASLEYYHQALKLNESIGNLQGKASVLVCLSSALGELEDHPKAIECLNQALTLSKALGDSLNEARTYNRFGMTYKDKGDFQKALESFHQALAIARAIENPELEFMVGNNMGIAYKYLGDYAKALDTYEQSLKIIRNLGNGVGEVQLLNNIGNIYKSQGENQKALDYYNQALPIFRRLKMRGGEATVLNNMGGVYYELGEPQKALGFHEQAQAIRKALGDRRGESSALNLAGRAWSKLGELDKAQACLRQALEIRHQINDPIGEAETRLHLAAVERDRGNLAASQTEIETALSMIESLRANISDANLRASYVARVQESYEFYVDLLMRQHQAHPAAGYAVAALQAAERAHARVLLESLVEARANIRQGVDAALLNRERALQQQLNLKSERLTQLLSGKHTEEQKAGVEKELNDLSMNYQEVQAQIRQSSPRYAALTQPQPLTVNEIQQQLDDHTVLLEFALGGTESWLWAVSRSSFNSFKLPPYSAIEPSARKVYEWLTARQPRKGESAAQYQTRIAEADVKLQSESTTLSQLLFEPIATKLEGEWQGKRLAIVASGALEYIPFAALPVPVDDSQWSAIRKAGVRGQGSGISEKEIAHQLPTTDHRPLTTDYRLPTGDYRPLIADHEIINLPSVSVLAAIRKEGPSRKAPDKTVAVLADPVFEPGDPRVLNAMRKNTNRNLVAKDQSRDDPPIIAVAKTPSSSDLQFLRSLRSFNMINERGGFSRLPFSREEAEAIATLAGKTSSMKATDFQATRSAVTSGDLARFRIIHFATHGLLNSERPELSGLVLSLVDEQGKAQDGFLRMNEIYNLRLPAELVVLSACQTALGKQIRGEGLVGLTRGFMYAGAERVVASLWQVDDLATAELMKRFYRGMLKEELRPAAALRAAQLEMLKQGRWASPYFWAAFTLQGEWR